MDAISIEIISGIIFGLMTFGGTAYWLNKRTALKALGDSQAPIENEKNDWEARSLPLEQKLRNAIFDCEQNIKKCKNELTELYKNQLDLVQNLGKKSYVEVKGKPLFFEYNNLLTKERFFYYERDLHQQQNETMLEKTQQLLKEYNQQAGLLWSQQDFFEQLIDSHKENIDRLTAIKDGNHQMNKINEHEQKIALTNHQNIEEKAIYNDLVLQEINEELDYQEECLEQYVLLHKKYEIITDENSNEKLSIEIQEMIKHLEDKNPNL